MPRPAADPDVPDPGDVSRCPTGDECGACGDTSTLAVYRGDTQLGTCCLTLCGECARAGAAPVWSVLDAMTRIGEHAAHLGTDLDGLAAAERYLRD